MLLRFRKHEQEQIAHKLNEASVRLQKTMAAIKASNPNKPPHSVTCSILWMHTSGHREQSVIRQFKVFQE